MSTPIYPLKFDPIYQYRLWGGRKLAHLLSKPLPENEPIGEAWLLSDRDDHASKVSEGELKGTTLTELMKKFAVEIMGKIENHSDRFPLLLKFLDCKEVLSVQVHPSDDQKQYIPKGDSGKTEAWVVLETSKDSRIYAGLKKGTTKENLIESIKNKSVPNRLHSFVPKKDDAIFIHSGTVHTLGGTVVFEVQENSDVTFRLYDWDRNDPKTGKPRELQVENAIACIDFNQVDIKPVVPMQSPEFKNAEILFDNEHFKLWRIKSKSEFTVGFKDEPTILVCAEGKGSIKYNNQDYLIGKGEVMLLPAIIGQLNLQPEEEIMLLQITIPDKK
ncbi:type I phosphomannose isomerase catalytic subunit [Kaistella jeonii]|uniref:Phosphohexomutase n=1 Tax=Kaistella jeonii TaxID=266749 RepID=A0A0C1CPN7_9FLAO|nr:type I phosphomannose isomerase catalytic subunit [Kaistella jeonii]KIA86051.1 mannose-6-phosphate isomerase [Kaistella jeonii]SFC36409.1 mannose-6-phosphate isomerase [Kaistella jeonii]VEI97302.1 Probable mannose-6-phosphate isomerase gmuF [Kaistella jeonii]